MALITKPDFTYVWASGGAVVAPNDTKKQQGWVAEAPPFQWDNWLQNRQDQMLAHINQRGMCAWDGLTNYEAAGLSYVQGSDGKIYKSVATSGPLTTVQDPTTDVADTYWTEAFASIGAFITQTAADARYTLRGNNLSDVTSAITAFNNIKQPASETSTGVIELSTQAETDAGLSDSVTVTPLKLRFGFAISLAVNGYVKFPSWMGGLVVQWGAAATDVNGNATPVFPISFPTAARQIVISPSGTNGNVVATYSALTVNGFTIKTRNNGDTLNVATAVSFIAIGN